jgi:hypothetical protein
MARIAAIEQVMNLRTKIRRLDAMLLQQLDRPDRRQMATFPVRACCAV